MIETNKKFGTSMDSMSIPTFAWLEQTNVHLGSWASFKSMTLPSASMIEEK